MPSLAELGWTEIGWADVGLDDNETAGLKMKWARLSRAGLKWAELR